MRHHRSKDLLDTIYGWGYTCKSIDTVYKSWSSSLKCHTGENFPTPKQPASQRALSPKVSNAQSPELRMTLGFREHARPG